MSTRTVVSACGAAGCAFLSSFLAAGLAAFAAGLADFASPAAGSFFAELAAALLFAAGLAGSALLPAGAGFCSAGLADSAADGFLSSPLDFNVGP